MGILQKKMVYYEEFKIKQHKKVLQENHFLLGCSVIPFLQLPLNFFYCCGDEENLNNEMPMLMSAAGVERVMFWNILISCFIWFSPHFMNTFYAAVTLAQLRLKVLDTDYTNYVLMYGCANTGSGKSRQYAFIFTRSRNPSPNEEQLYHQIIKSKTGQSRSDLMTMDTRKC